MIIGAILKDADILKENNYMDYILVAIGCRLKNVPKQENLSSYKKIINTLIG